MTSAVFTHEHNGEKFVLVQGRIFEKPSIVLGKMTEELGMDYKGPMENVARLYGGRAGQYVRFEQVSDEIKEDVLRSF